MECGFKAASGTVEISHSTTDVNCRFSAEAPLLVGTLASLACEAPARRAFSGRARLAMSNRCFARRSAANLPAVFLQLAVERRLADAQHSRSLQLVIFSDFEGILDGLLFQSG